MHWMMEKSLDEPGEKDILIFQLSLNTWYLNCLPTGKCESWFDFYLWEVGISKVCSLVFVNVRFV